MDTAEDVVRSPERDLVVAIVDEARCIAIGEARTGFHSYAEWRRAVVAAQDWFRSASEEPWSFRWCCAILNQDAKTVLAALERQFVTTTPAEIEAARTALKTATPATPKPPAPKPTLVGSGMKPCPGVPNTSRMTCGKTISVGAKLCNPCGTMKYYYAAERRKEAPTPKPVTPKRKTPLKSAASTGAVGGAIASIERERQQLQDGIDEMQERVDKIDQALKTLRSLA